LYEKGLVINKNMNDILNCLKREVGIHKYIWLDTLYNIILKEKPLKIVEFGTKTGLTAITMALALKEIGSGKIVTYDCFDKEVEGRVSDVVIVSETIKNINRWHCGFCIDVRKMDFYDWIKDPESFDLMYCDIDNDGDKIKLLFEATYDQLKKGSVILFEGGSLKRDMVKWMVGQNKTSMNSIKDYVNYKVIDERFPSLSIIKL
jgi:predicted O-methyltransferase YrrM